MLPCPFCGSAKTGGAVAREHPVEKFRTAAKANPTKAFAYCSACGACGPVSTNAFQAWQSRAL